MAQFEFKLPDIGEGVVEGEIVKWLVKPGDQIVEDQPLVEVMTDKATVTIPSPRRGKVVQTFGKEGDIAKVHSTLVVLDLDGEGTAQATPTSGVPAQAPPPRMQALAQDEVRPMRGLRKSIAKSMVQSHTYVVPFTFVEECDTSALTSLRERINAELARRGEAKLSYLPFIAKALLHGFARYPELNAVMDEEKQALVVKKDVNLGFGAATEQGLTVFVVKDVRSKTIREIGAEIDRLGKAAREQKLQLQDLQGSTFTIT